MRIRSDVGLLLFEAVGLVPLVVQMGGDHSDAGPWLVNGDGSSDDHVRTK